MNPVSLSKMLAVTERTDGELRVQCLAVDQKETKGGKPYYELSISDGSATAKLRVWNNHRSFGLASEMQAGDCYSLKGGWWRGEFGLESDDWEGRLLESAERAAVFAGPAELREKQERDWNALVMIVADLPEGTLKTVTMQLLTEYEEPYRRAAAARGNHHARRGGLVEHVSLMAQAAVALCAVYSELRRDLLVAGVVFHDSGKMIENQYQAEGFDMPFSFRAECYGHIPIGVQLLHRLWGKLDPEVQERDRVWLDALSHLILSHHGTLEWGSPVEPKLPEAQVLHYVDNLDAKLEMMRQMRANGKVIAPGVYERQRPLSVNLLALPVGS